MSRSLRCLRPGGRALVLALVLALSVGGLAVAQRSWPRRPVTVRWEAGRPRVRVDLRDLVDRAARRKLRSGLPQRITVAVAAYPQRGGRAIAGTLRTCRITFDLWREAWRVQRSEPGREAVWVLPREDLAIERCLRLHDVAVGSAERYRRWRGQEVFFGGRAEFNPLSAATVRRLRRWLGRRSGGAIEGEAFFGSVVGLFVDRRIADAERTVRFRSAPVRVPSDG